MPGKTWIPTLTKLTTNPSPERLQDNVNTALQGFQNGIADGQMMVLKVSTQAVSGNPPTLAILVNHPLGRKPQAVHMGAANCFCSVAIDPVQPSGIDLTKQIQLDFLSSASTFPATLIAPLWFF